MITIADTEQIQVDVQNTLAKESAARDCWPIFFAEYEEPEPPIVESFSHIDGWLSLIRQELYSNPTVEDIFVNIEGGDVDVWVVIPERDLAVLDQLADIEWELLELFVSGEQPVFLIDFHIIYRCGRDIEDLAPTKALRLLR